MAILSTINGIDLMLALTIVGLLIHNRILIHEATDHVRAIIEITRELDMWNGWWNAQAELDGFAVYNSNCPHCYLEDKYCASREHWTEGLD